LGCVWLCVRVCVRVCVCEIEPVFMRVSVSVYEFIKVVTFVCLHFDGCRYLVQLDRIIVKLASSPRVPFIRHLAQCNYRLLNKGPKHKAHCNFLCSRCLCSRYDSVWINISQARQEQELYPLSFSLCRYTRHIDCLTLFPHLFCFYCGGVKDFLREQ
jgi:hypothetical protein